MVWGGGGYIGRATCMFPGITCLAMATRTSSSISFDRLSVRLLLYGFAGSAKALTCTACNHRLHACTLPAACQALTADHAPRCSRTLVSTPGRYFRQGQRKHAIQFRHDQRKACNQTRAGKACKLMVDMARAITLSSSSSITPHPHIIRRRYAQLISVRHAGPL